MADRCFPLVVDNLKQYPVTVTVSCREVWFREEKNAASQDYQVFEPYTASQAINRAGGETHIFRAIDGKFVAGQIVGYIQTVAGSFTGNVEQK